MMTSLPSTGTYMAVSRDPLFENRHPAILYDVIENVITKLSTLKLSGLHILELAVKCVDKTAPPSSDWLRKVSVGLEIIPPDQGYHILLFEVDHWVLLHLDTLLAPHPYLLPDEVTELKWSDTPEKVYIARARLDLFDSLANAEYEGVKASKPNPELLTVFLWSKDYEVCTRAFRWCLDLVPISLPGTLGDADSTRIFVPETMGSRWVEHFIHVLCNGNHLEGSPSLDFLISHLVPKWSMLPSSWCCDFASTLLFCIVHPLDIHNHPAYQYIAERAVRRQGAKLRGFLCFLGTLLGLIKSSWTWSSLASFENWLDWGRESHHEAVYKDTHTQMEHILTTVKQRHTEETLGFFAELPMAGSWMDE